MSNTKFGLLSAFKERYNYYSKYCFLLEKKENAVSSAELNCAVIANAKNNLDLL